MVSFDAMDTHSDVIVLGAGVIGLSLAFELAQQNLRVTLYDIGVAFSGASSAAGGMLVPWTEVHEPTALQHLCTASFAMYPSFVSRLQQYGSVTLRLNGVLEIAHTAERLAEFERRAMALLSAGIDARMLRPEELADEEPLLAHDALGGLLTRAGGCVANRELGHALHAACVASDVAIYEHVASPEIVHDDERVIGVRIDGAMQSCTTLINAMGAWANNAIGVPPSCNIPVAPVRGQLISLRTCDEANLRRVTWSQGIYAVPRGDGHIDIGATSENVGFDVRNTKEGTFGLLEAARRAFPTLRESSCFRAWAGLRPATPDGWPILGKTPLDGYILATGHYRHGILLAPITASLVARSIINDDFSELAPFALERPSLHREPEVVC